MFNTLKTAALSALIGLGALAAVPAVAQADGVYLNFGHSGPRFGVYDGGREQVRDWRRDRDWRDRDWRRSCTPERALDKAERMGLRRARVVDMGRSTIKVAGRKYSDRVVVVFGRDRGCPIIYR
ncbi:MAG: hypothetical protein J0I98_10550 [Mesorhizobium sp.]|mgnify:CR=1 FL=1|nr:hypothetical protein [Mesorhizobium sp.]MBN9243223.1 hypothetical protein [Mesorhizobium sp.]